MIVPAWRRRPCKLRGWSAEQNVMKCISGSLIAMYQMSLLSDNIGQQHISAAFLCDQLPHILITNARGVLSSFHCNGYTNPRFRSFIKWPV